MDTLLDSNVDPYSFERLCMVISSNFLDMQMFTRLQANLGGGSHGAVGLISNCADGLQVLLAMLLLGDGMWKLAVGLRPPKYLSALLDLCGGGDGDGD
jgi:hypothetical protein